MHRLTFNQQGALMRLWHAPSYELLCGEILDVTAQALIRKGYIETLSRGRKCYYGLTYAGIRYCQTGKVIGE